MEKILAGMTLEPSSLWAGIHALNLAKRMKAHVSLLLVIQPGQDNTASHHQGVADPMTDRIKAMIDEGRDEGIALNYYQAIGDYAGELIHFIQHNKITLLVIASPGENDVHEADFKEFLEKLHHRLNCRIEVVHMKPLS